MWQHTFGGNTFFTGAGIQSKRVNTDALVFPSTVNGGLAESEFFKDPATTGSQRYMLPNETGTMALTSIKDLPRDPTVADIPNNTSRVVQFKNGYRTALCKSAGKAAGNVRIQRKIEKRQ